MNNSQGERDTTHFGFQQVPAEEKAERVAGIFHSVASKYDLMNDLMSLGLHRLWKRYTIEMSGVRAGQRVLDIAGGTGDLAAQFSALVGEQGEVILADINESMLQVGREQLVNRGLLSNIHYVQTDAECLPFPEHYFDCISIAFGLRNVTDKDAALHAMQQVLKPGGRLLVLEFSKPVAPGLAPIYDAYSFKLLPLMGRLIARDEASYRYLAESIRVHPEQQAVQKMMEQAGLEHCDYFNLSGGIVALHRGYKL
jgi:demethylmenaquinone methyltransferase/2-methoxy-6-polyprenyl-1,4-benzoquinol methylase